MITIITNIKATGNVLNVYYDNNTVLSLSVEWMLIKVSAYNSIIDVQKPHNSLLALNIRNKFCLLNNSLFENMNILIAWIQIRTTPVTIMIYLG